MYSLLLCAALAPAGHEADNPLYRDLLDPGLVVGTNLRVKLPAPLMPDGLAAAKQKEIIEKLIGTDYSFEDFTRKSQVAPHILRIHNAEPSDPKSPSRALDTYFVAYVDLKAFDDERFLERSLNIGKGEGGKAKAITRDDLIKRGIDPKYLDSKKEGYAHVQFDFLDKVRLRITGRGMASKTGDSIVAGAEVDSRFRGDKEFPNEWQPLSKESGKLQAGPAQAYGGAGLYVKITKLVEPVGAVFVEQHIVFAEPTGWFNGANLLRSKLPPVVTISVRRMREAWAKGVGK
ncbi:MAG TPA: hypothetical protein VN641_09100 [Urbifossiella sp.]|jgi:hypothetical protein|nr:hypothetical protein [Urbifossiella sp.]